MLLYYCLTAAVSYLLTILLGRLFKQVTDKLFAEDKRSILTTALPFLISATIISEIMLFRATFFYYLTGFIDLIIGLTCVSLTGYSYTTEWKVIGRLSNKRIIYNFILWTSFALVLTFICMGYLTSLMAYPVLIILTTYFFLKWRNINKPTVETQP
jgi:hypothetical protein